MRKARTALEAKRDEVRAELDRLAEQLAAFGVEQELESGGVGNHLAEDGSSVQEQEQILVISGDLRDVLTQVDDALGRLDDGTYGQCLRCGQPINPERLGAFPYVAYCIECQTIIERQGHVRPATIPAR
jgi:DnaK suppressor protein